MPVRHAFHSTRPDSSDTSLVSSSEWNDDHILTGPLVVDGLALYYTPEMFGTVTGTNDNAIVAAAVTAAAGRVPVVFTSGNTYCFEGYDPPGNIPGGGLLEIDGTHIIVQPGATCKQKADGGVGQIWGLFYLLANNIRIDNYGTIDGNNSNMTGDYTTESYAHVIATFNEINNFVYDDHKTGIITNTAAGGILLSFTGAGNQNCIESARFVDCLQQANFSGAAAIWCQDANYVTIKHMRMTGSPGWGIRMIANALAFHIDDVLVDLRGMTVPSGVVSGGAIEVNEVGAGVDLIDSGSTLSNLTFFGPDAAGASVSIVAGVSLNATATSTLALSNINIYGNGTVNAPTYGAEIHGSSYCVSSLLVDGADVGLLIGGQVGGPINAQATIRNTRSDAVQVVTGNAPLQLDLAIQDCGVSSGRAMIVQDIVGSPPNISMRVNALYKNIDTNIAFSFGGAGKMLVHDSLIINEMAGSRRVGFDFAGAGAGVVGCTMIGKGDTGNAVVMTGAGNRIIGCHFKDYSKPWDTSGGSNTLIETNLVESCTTAAGSVAGTDTSANNKSF